MADFFKKDDAEEVKVEGEEQVEEQEVPEKVKIGEDEYTQDELNSLVALGKIGKEAEEKYDTKIDKVWPDYTKKSQLLKELEEKERVREEENKAAVEKKADEGEELTPQEQRERAISQANELGLVTKDSFKEFYRQQRDGERLLEECTGLEKELDGKDGRPAFSTKEVLDHMASTGIRDPNRAYKDKHEEQLDRWKEEKISGSKREGLVSEGSSATGSKEPAKVDINRGNLDKLISESLYGKS